MITRPFGAISQRLIDSEDGLRAILRIGSLKTPYSPNSRSIQRRANLPFDPGFGLQQP